MIHDTSQDSLIIPEEVISKWQNIINTMAKIIDVPSGLIMRLVGSDITVFLSSETKNNPYTPGDKEHFEDSGLYCETVIKNNDMLLVPDALHDEEWKDNPDIKLNMISYLGFPIVLPDKTPFGTICVLDNKENEYSDLYKDLVANFRDTIERDIELLYSNHSLNENLAVIQSLLDEKETLLKEVHHRVKNNISNIESLLSLQASSAKSAEVKTALKDTVSRVRSMRVLYEKLLITGEYRQVSMKNYIEGLIRSLIAVFPDKQKVTIEKNISDFTLSPKKAVPVGIILNELLTNVYKYAFIYQDNGIISITIDKTGNIVTVTVHDNGVGIDEKANVDISPGFGLTLVRMLSEQLNGSYRIENDNGTKSVVTFEI